MGNVKGRSLKLPNLAELIYSGLNLRFLTLIDNSTMYRYNGGFYEPDAEQLIKKLAEEILEEDTKINYKREVVEYIRDKNYQDRRIFNGNKKLLNFKNGVLNLDTWEFTEHSPDYYFLNEIPVEYEPDAKTEKIEEFLKSVVTESDYKILQELFGYCLYRSYPYQKAFMFVGSGANGKSTVLTLLNKLLGEDNISSISLQDIAERPFATANLYGKLANIYADISDKSLSRTGIFKMVTGGDNLHAEKKFKEGFNFRNHAKLIFSANKVPEAKDDTDAYFRRWIFINFPNTFEGDKCDPNILDKLIPEMSGLLNFAIEGLKRLLENNGFSDSKTTEQTREKYQRLSSPIASFVMDCIVEDSESYILKDVIYNRFIEYCKENGMPIVAKNVFSMKIHEHVHVSDYRPRINNKREQAWRGIAFLDEKSQKNDDFCDHPDQNGKMDILSYGEKDGWSGRSTLLCTYRTHAKIIDYINIIYNYAHAGVHCVKKHPDRIDTLDPTDIEKIEKIEFGQGGHKKQSENADLAGFDTIKKQHVEWTKNKLRVHNTMPYSFFEQEFYNEFGQSFKAHEIQRLYDTVKKNTNQKIGDEEECF